MTTSRHLHSRRASRLLGPACRVLALGALVVTLLAGGPGPSGAAGSFPDPASAASARHGASYLVSLQDAAGSIPPGARADLAAEAIVAIAAGDAPADALEGALGYLATVADEDTTEDAGKGPYAGRIVTALVATGTDPRNFAGVDFVARIRSAYNPAVGSYRGENLYADTLAILGLLAAHEPLPGGPVNPISYLLNSQCENGGWSHQTGCLGSPDTDTTAMALSVVAAARGTQHDAVRAGRQWLRDAQHQNGCWGYQAGANENANSCALAISAIVALGEDPTSATWTRDRDPAARLRDFQFPSGAFRYLATSSQPNTYATVQAVPALAGVAHPVDRLWEPPDSPATPTTTTSTTSTTGGSSTTTAPGARSGAVASGREGATSTAPTTAPGNRSSASPVTTTSLAIPLSDIGVAGGSAGGTERVTPGAPPNGGLATATLDDGAGSGPGLLPTGLALGSLGSAAAGTGWAWRRRAVAALEVVSSPTPFRGGPPT